jgi:LysR family glycine cleavage system transcriptional activator
MLIGSGCSGAGIYVKDNRHLTFSIDSLLLLSVARKIIWIHLFESARKTLEQPTEKGFAFDCGTAQSRIRHSTNEFISSISRNVRSLPPLAALRAFEAAARHLSFKRAADELGVTPTAISHQIRLLEATLQQKLFERRTRQVVLTDAGHLLFGPLRDGFDAFGVAIDRIRSRDAPASITLTATLAFTSRWIVPRIDRFRARNPGLSLRVLASNDVIDVRRGEADIAVRYGPGVYEGCTAEPLFQETYAPVCSPQLSIRAYEDLREYPLIHTEWQHPDERTPTWPRWQSQAGLNLNHPGTQLVLNDQTDTIQAAAAGHGVALASTTFAADELASGALRIPFGPFLEGHHFHVVFANRPSSKEKVDAVRDWLASEAARFVDQSLRLPES